MDEDDKREESSSMQMLYNATDAGRYLGVSRATVLRYFWMRKLSAHYVGANGVPLFTAESLDTVRTEINENRRRNGRLRDE